MWLIWINSYSRFIGLLLNFKWRVIDFQIGELLTFSSSSFLDLQNFAKEFMFNDLKELDEENIRNELKKAGGANYDAQAE